MLADASGYHLDDEPVARGAQGEVRLGRDAAGREIAVKIARGSAEARENLLHEIAVLRTLQAAGVRGVVEVLDVIDVGGQPGMVMPRYPSHLGRWLDDITTARDSATLDEILRRTAQLARILAGVHAQRAGGIVLVHRDVKPENIYIDRQGELHLGDFGGSLEVDGLHAVELALFGSWMWAPFDQILPGVAIPDPTWDTFATCVILYGALTGRRPAFQADPRGLLTPFGRQLWELARAVAEAPAPERQARADVFLDKRRHTHAVDLVEMTGKSSLIASDRHVITAALEELAELADLPPTARDMLQRTVWALLVRGLSPVAHPSPPNRYRDAAELADQLDDLRRVLRTTGMPTRDHTLESLTGGPPPQRLVPPPRPPPSLLRASPAPWVLAGAAVTIAGGAAWWATRGPDTVRVPATATTRVYDLDRLEVSARRWRACVADDACPPLPHDDNGAWPAAGVSHDDAAAFCAWSGGRLPTVDEWLAAAGTAPRPWGHAAPSCAHAAFATCGRGLAPVGDHPRGASAAGALDMAGNVWEWADGPEGPVLLGGGATSTPEQLGALGQVRPGQRGFETARVLAGVRCAWDHPE